jgi:transcriptional regulator with XRE-family HTH domain
MVDRILALIREKQLTPSQFADEIGVQRSGMSHIISGRNKPSLEFIMKVLKRYPEVKAEWLLYGTVNSGQEAISDTMADMQPVKDLESEMNREIKNQATLFDELETTSVKPENKPPRIVKREKSERKIEKIVIFYDDRSFREYEPEK